MEGHAELALGVRRRRWVLGVLAFLMAVAALASGTIALRMVPARDRAYAEQEANIEALETATAIVDAHRRQQLGALVDESAGDLRRSADLGVQLVGPIAVLSEHTDDPSAVRALSEAAINVDAEAEMAADLVQSGDVEQARVVLAGDAGSGDALDGALLKVRRAVDQRSLAASNDSAGLLRLIAFALFVPVVPTAWVFAQLIVGVRQIRRIGQQMHDVSREVSSSAAQLSAASEELAASSVEGAAAFTEALATIEELAQGRGFDRRVGRRRRRPEPRHAIEHRSCRPRHRGVERPPAHARRPGRTRSARSSASSTRSPTRPTCSPSMPPSKRPGPARAASGFTVVAEEVRRLAERSKSSSAQIADIIDGAQAETSATVLAMEKGAKQMQHAMAFMDTVAGASADGRMTRRAAAQRDAAGGHHLRAALRQHQGGVGDHAPDRCFRGRSREPRQAARGHRGEQRGRCVTSMPAQETPTEALVFPVGTEWHAVDCSPVREVVRAGSVTPVPVAPDWLAGW